MHGPSDIFDQTTLFCVLGLCGLSFIAIRYSSSYTFPVVVVPIVTLHIYYFPRIAAYLLSPNILTTPFSDFFSRIKSPQLNEVLQFIFFGLAAVLIGLFLGDFLCQRFLKKKLAGGAFQTIQKTMRIQHSAKFLVATFVVWCGFDLFFEHWIGLNLFNPTYEGQLRTFWVGLKVFFGVDTCFFVVFSVLFFEWKKNERGMVVLLFLAFLYLTLLTAGGSKGGVLRVDQIVVLLLAFAYPASRIPFKAYLGLAAASILLGVFTFYAGAAVRTKGLDDDMYGIYDSIYASDVRRLDSESIPGPVLKLIPILNRLGEIDYPVYMMTAEIPENLKEKFLSISYMLKSLVNILAPGEPYPESSVSTNRLVPVLFRGVAIESVANSFNSEPWSIWTATKRYLGTPLALLFLLTSAIGFQILIYYLITIGVPEQPVVPAFILWSLGYVYFKCFGIDHFVSLTVFLVLQLGTVLAWLMVAPVLYQKLWKSSDSLNLKRERDRNRIRRIS